ncbi:MAG: HEPN domain-containing protein [Deltaproteobacteria bacterium]|nr:HEPN domain-containing protein [Deltaproteobacteria bacterium]
MTLREGDKQALIKYRIERSIEAIDEAKMAYESNHLNLAVNRNYYACFYSIKALLLTKDIDYSDHGHVKGEFNKEFVHKGLVDKDYTKILENAFQQRQIGDYRDLIKFNKEGVKSSIKKAEEFVTEINKMTLKFTNKQEIENKQEATSTNLKNSESPKPDSFTQDPQNKPEIKPEIKRKFRR